MAEVIDSFYDMEIAEICQLFSKSRNTVDKAVAKLVKDYPDAGYKYKNPDTRRITIKAEGVEILSKYFRKEKHEISTVEVELRAENEKLRAIIEEKDKNLKQIETLYADMYQERLRKELELSQQTFLLEQQSKDERIQELELQTQEQSEQLAQLESLQTELDEHKKRAEEYNSKSLFYRLFHKL